MATLSSIRKKYGASGRKLYIDEFVEREIKQIIEFAEQNIVSNSALYAAAVGDIKPVASDTRRVCSVPRGFRVIYSVEDQAIGLCRHLTVSLGDSKSLPSKAVINDLMSIFGFEGEMDDCYIWVEELRTTTAINLIQPLKWDRTTFTLT